MGLLDKCNASPKACQGAEKLDLLLWIADAVQKSIETGYRMDLTLSELREFLINEDMVATCDAKQTPQLLLDLRIRELARLAKYDEAAQARREAERLAIVIAEKSAEEVQGCFSNPTLEGLEEEAGTKRSLEEEKDGTQERNKKKMKKETAPSPENTPSMLRIGIKTRGADMKLLLDKCNASPKACQGAEKLDLLLWIADAVQKSIETGHRMDLTISELREFLVNEGMIVTCDTKQTPQLLLDLRIRELARLVKYDEVALARKEAERFAIVIAEKSAEEVQCCFSDAIVPFDA